MHRNDMSTADNLAQAMEKLDNPNATQLMKAVATLSASNVTKRMGKGGAAKDQ